MIVIRNIFGIMEGADGRLSQNHNIYMHCIFIEGIGTVHEGPRED